MGHTLRNAPNANSVLSTGLFSTFAIAILLSVCTYTQASADDSSKEYQVKLGFVVNFIKFIDWPESAVNKDRPFVIAVFGDIPIKEGVQEIPDVEVNHQTVVMHVNHTWDPNSEDHTALIDHCQALFITNTEQEHTGAMIERVKSQPVMTVGETPDFLKSGGIFNFEVEKNKVRFSVSLKNAQNAQLSIRSKLLRLAKHVDK